MEEMREANRKSIDQDGIEDVKDGCLVYTDELREKVGKLFMCNFSPIYILMIS
jgi:hypothetical protein